MNSPYQMFERLTILALSLVDDKYVGKTCYLVLPHGDKWNGKTGQIIRAKLTESGGFALLVHADKGKGQRWFHPASVCIFGMLNVEGDG